MTIFSCYAYILTHWGRVTHICIDNLTIIGSDNGLSPGRHQAIIWTNVVILLIGPLGTNFSEILIRIHTLSFKKMHLKMSSLKWCPFCLGLNVILLILNAKCENVGNVWKDICVTTQPEPGRFKEGWRTSGVELMFLFTATKNPGTTHIVQGKIQVYQ